MLLCGAFYPNYFSKGETDETQAVRFISGQNPFTTVMVRNLSILNTENYIHNKTIIDKEIDNIYIPCIKVHKQ